MAKELGLDKPKIQQYLIYLGDLAHGNLGRSLRSERPVTTELVEEVAIGARGGDDPADTVEISQVYAAISQLPDEFRDALVAVDIVGLSYPEAARALGVPEGTVTSRLFRARDRVARLLRE